MITSRMSRYRTGGFGSRRARLFGLLTTTDLDVPDKRSFVFLEQKGVSDEQLEDMLKFTDSIVFYGNKNLDDFALSSLDREYHYPALDCWTNDYHSPWTRDFFYASTWLGAAYRSGNPGILTSVSG